MEDVVGFLVVSLGELGPNGPTGFLTGCPNKVRFGSPVGLRVVISWKRFGLPFGSWPPIVRKSEDGKGVGSGITPKRESGCAGADGVLAPKRVFDCAGTGCELAPKRELDCVGADGALVPKIPSCAGAGDACAGVPPMLKIEPLKDDVPPPLEEPCAKGLFPPAEKLKSEVGTGGLNEDCAPAPNVGNEPLPKPLFD